MKLGFVGLGRMGSAMASSLLRAGHEVTVYNRTPSKAEALRRAGARVARSPADAARGTRTVATMLSDVLNGSMLRSDVLGAYGTKIADGEFDPAGFRLSLGLKDVQLALDAAEAAGVSMPFGNTLRDRFAAAVDRGLETKDWSAVTLTVPRRAPA